MGFNLEPLPEQAPSPPTVASQSQVPALEFRHITKRFPGQTAVDDVSMSVMPGEVMALVGENGAGKTTLIKILAGRYSADAGTILLDGEEARLSHPSYAMVRGIGFIHQEPALIPTMSVAENLTLGEKYPQVFRGWIDWSRHLKMAHELLSRVGLDVNPRAPLGSLSVADRQLVAIARLLAAHLRVVVFDEPTAPLTEDEVDRLFAIIAQMKSEGTAIVYISHRLEEVFRVADRVTVMRNGRWIDTQPVADVDTQKLTHLIIGKDPAAHFSQTAEPKEESRTVLSVRGLSDELLSDVSFDLHEGEVLGLAGLTGSGRSNVLEIIFGARKPVSGSIELDGVVLTLKHPADAVSKGIALVTEDRKRNGYVPTFPIWQHITLPWLSHYTHARFLLDLRLERKRAREASTRLDVRARSVNSEMRELSGGNQQKAILARWLSQKLRVLLLDEPTHGVDIGAKEEIYRIIRSLAKSGLPIVVVSSEFEELEGLCDRVLLLVEGRLIGELRGTDIDHARIVHALFQRSMEPVADVN